MKTTNLSAGIVFFSALCLVPNPGLCDEATNSEPSQSQTEECVAPEYPRGTTSNAGIVAGSSFFSAYAYRGRNVFQEKSQNDQHGVFSLSLHWFILGSGFWMGYRGFMQTNGSNADYNIDVGIGLEQNLVAGWNHEFKPGLSTSASFRYRFYPFSSHMVTGVNNPSYFEPGISLTYSPKDIVDLELGISYLFTPIDSLDHDDYLYIIPSISKLFDFNSPIGLLLKFAIGYKAIYKSDLNHHTRVPLNAFIEIGTPIAFVKALIITPQFGVHWTNDHGSEVRKQIFVLGGVTIKARP